jgi:hypothetical protein
MHALTTRLPGSTLVVDTDGQEGHASPVVHLVRLPRGTHATFTTLDSVDVAGSWWRLQKPRDPCLNEYHPPTWMIFTDSTSRCRPVLRDIRPGDALVGMLAPRVQIHWQGVELSGPVGLGVIVAIKLVGGMECRVQSHRALRMLSPVNYTIDEFTNIETIENGRSALIHTMYSPARGPISSRYLLLEAISNQGLDNDGPLLLYLEDQDYSGQRVLKVR